MQAITIPEAKALIQNGTKPENARIIGNIDNGFKISFQIQEQTFNINNIKKRIIKRYKHFDSAVNDLIKLGIPEFNYIDEDI